MISADPTRWALAAGALLSYGALCMAMLRQRAAPGAPAGEHDWLVAYASQTGTAEFFAERSAARLRAGGLHARAVSVDRLDPASLRGDARILFIVSTYGEGDAPDSAARLMRILAASELRLDRLHYAVLALGDSSYAQFCGFGRQLDASLKALGAHSLFERIEADRSAPEALAAWQEQLGRLANFGDDADWSAPAPSTWRIAARTLMNPGSAGAPVYQVILTPDGALPAWQAGDLADVSVPDDRAYPRAYSIASIASEGHLALLVRLHVREDGAPGLASSLLCVSGATEVALRIRPHQRFRIGDNGARPLILIGNGTGMAGLRAHLKARVQAGQRRNWLIYGERNAAHDALYGAETAAWQLDKLSLAYSRDGGPVRYVQHAIEREAEAVRAWVRDGAAIYVCGSLQGMAAGVHDALTAALGEQLLAELDETGRYRRDVY